MVTCWYMFHVFRSLLDQFLQFATQSASFDALPLLVAAASWSCCVFFAIFLSWLKTISRSLPSVPIVTGRTSAVARAEACEICLENDMFLAKYLHFYIFNIVCIFGSADRAEPFKLHSVNPNWDRRVATELD